LAQAPINLVTQADLEAALTAEKVRELAGPKGKPEALPALIKLVLESGQSTILRQVQRAVKSESIYALWVTRWTDLDKAELRRMILSACIYYLHFYGQKGEEVPESVQAELEAVKAEAKEVGDHVATLANTPAAASSALHELIPNLAAGDEAPGFARSKWRNL